MRRAPRPEEVSLQLATAGGRLEAGNWFFERKLDGVRCLVHVVDGVVQLHSRQGRPYETRLPTLNAAVRAQASTDLIADGELVALEDGVTSFPLLQRLLARSDPVVAGVYLYVFDLLWLADRDLRPLPLDDRKVLLDGALSFDDPLRHTAYRPAAHDRQDALLAEACGHGWEGLIAKRPTAPYRGGRSRAWRKLPCLSEGAFAVAGWTEGRRRGVGALLLARRTPGGLRYVGKVGSGFDDRHRQALAGFLEQVERATPAVLDPPDDRGIRWVQPVLTVRVEHLGWTQGGRLRQPRFLSVVYEPDGPPDGHPG